MDACTTNQLMMQVEFMGDTKRRQEQIEEILRQTRSGSKVEAHKEEAVSTLLCFCGGACVPCSDYRATPAWEAARVGQEGEAGREAAAAAHPTPFTPKYHTRHQQ